MDIATDFANPEVYSTAKKRKDSLPPVVTDRPNRGAKKRQTAPAKLKSAAAQIHICVRLELYH